MLLAELAFLDDASMAVPSSLPRTSMWLAQTWQQRVLDEELDELGRHGDRYRAGRTARLESGQVTNLGQEGTGCQSRVGQIRAAERGSGGGRDLRQRPGFSADGAHGGQGGRNRIRGGRLDPATAQRHQTAAGHRSDAGARWIPGGVADPRRGQVDLDRRHSAARARHGRGDRLGDHGRRHRTRSSGCRRVPRRPGDLAVLRSDAVRPVVDNACRRGTCAGHPGGARLAVRRCGASRLGRGTTPTGWARSGGTR